MKLSRLILILVAAMLLSIIIAIFYYQTTKVYDVQTLPMEVIITPEETIGMTIDTDRIHFGKLMRGDSATRTIIVNNEFDRQVLVSVRGNGLLGEMLHVKPNDFILDPGEIEEVALVLNIPLTAPFGNHSSTIDIFMLRP